MVLKIEIEKNPEPIFTPRNFPHTLSIRNPGATIYAGEIVLLLTIRNGDNKSDIYRAINPTGDGKTFLIQTPAFIPREPNRDSPEATEDPRVVWDPISKSYLITYTAFKGCENNENTTRIELATTDEFKKLKKRKIILDEYGNNKNCVIWVNKETKTYWIYHRPFSHKGKILKNPPIRLASSKDLEEFKDEGIFLEPRAEYWDEARVGMNTPPILIRHPEHGECLFDLYHGADKDNIYRIGYVLIDPENPKKWLERSEEPLLSPDQDFEKGTGKYSAEVKNVVFGQGAIPISKNKIRIYYAGADMHTNFADLTIQNIEILDEIFEIVT